MATVIPHIFEYCKIVNSLNENDKKKIATQKTFRRRRRKIKNPKIDYSKVKTLLESTPLFDQCYYQSQNIQFLLSLEQKFQKLRESNYNPVKFYNVKLETLIKESTRSASIECYQKPVEWPILQHNYSNGQHEEDRNWMAIDVILCIEFAKNLPFFNVLSLSDQKILLKSITSLNAILTAAYYSILLFSDAIIYPDGQMPIKYQIFQKAPHYRLFQEIIEPFKRITITKEEYILLKAMIFCSAKSPDISDEGKKILNNEFEKYSKLLLNHIQENYGAAAGAVKYSKILSIMEALIYFAQKGKEFYAFFGILFATSPIKTPLLLDEIF